LKNNDSIISKVLNQQNKTFALRTQIKMPTTPGEEMIVPYGGNYYGIISASGVISAHIGEDPAYVAPFGSIRILAEGVVFGKDNRNLILTSTVANDIVNITLGYGFEIPLDLITGGGSGGGIAAKGQYAFSTLVNPETQIFPFIGGMVERVGGGNALVQDFTTADGNSLQVSNPIRFVDTTTLGPGATASGGLPNDQSVIIFEVTALTAGDSLELLLSNSLSTVSYTPKCYEINTGEPTTATAAGAQITATGTYYAFMGGMNSFEFLATAGNAANVTLSAVSSNYPRIPASNGKLFENKQTLSNTVAGTSTTTAYKRPQNAKGTRIYYNINTPAAASGSVQLIPVNPVTQTNWNISGNIDSFGGSAVNVQRNVAILAGISNLPFGETSVIDGAIPQYFKIQLTSAGTGTVSVDFYVEWIY
jgi:hypothetical protein